MDSLYELSGLELVEKLEDLVLKQTVAIVEYKEVFREVLLMEVRGEMVWVYQKADFCAKKKSGIRQMRMDELILWEVVSHNVTRDNWVKMQEVHDAELATYQD